jgi:hypothetical protein
MVRHIQNMKSGIRSTLPNVLLITDRLFEVKLALVTLHQIRVKLKWKEIHKDIDTIAKLKS